MIDYLNQVARTKFRHSEASRKNIAARIAESATVDDCRAVIDHKAAQWIGNPEMEQYLNPTVLFRPQKFENNLVAAVRWIEQGRPAIGPNGKKDGVQESLDNIAAWLSRGEGEHGEQESGGDGYGNAGDGVGAEGDGAGDGGVVVDPLAIV